MSDADSSERMLQPIPWHVELMVGVITNPRAASILLGLPFALAAYGLLTIGWFPLSTAVFPPVVDAVVVWFASSLTFFIVLSRPY